MKIRRTSKGNHKNIVISQECIPVGCARSLTVCCSICFPGGTGGGVNGSRGTMVGGGWWVSRQPGGGGLLPGGLLWGGLLPGGVC